jgi:hypothetical protein
MIIAHLALHSLPMQLQSVTRRCLTAFLAVAQKPAVSGFAMPGPVVKIEWR